ncbi:unnamed protein product, partial [Hapterophycus canaliculatus]
HHKTTIRSSKALGTSHMDVAGPYESPVGRSRHLVTLSDSCPRWRRVYGVRTKAGILACLNKFIADMGKMECLRVDSARENTSPRFVVFRDDNNVRRELAC